MEDSTGGDAYMENICTHYDGVPLNAIDRRNQRQKDMCKGERPAEYIPVKLFFLTFPV